MAFGGAEYGASSSGPHNGGGVWIFVDNSNIWIEAKKLAASLRGMETDEDLRLRINYGTLGDVVAAGRPVNKITLYGSKPPPNDTLWEMVRSQGWKVHTDDRSNITGKEKKVDTRMAVDITKLVCDKDNLQYGNTVIIITGDADIMPAVDCALETPPWEVEVRMWKSALAGDILRESKNTDRMTAGPLDDDFEEIAFINYRFNVSNSTYHLLCRTAVVLVNPQLQLVDLRQWRKKMDEECRYPFWYHGASVSGFQLVVVVFFIRPLNSNVLADMLEKIKRSSDLNLNAQTTLPFSAVADNIEFDDSLGNECDFEEPFTVDKSKAAESGQCQFKFNCMYGLDCAYVHSDAEMQFFSEAQQIRGELPQGYKTTMCGNYAEKGTCPYGDGCDFAHGDDDAICINCHYRGHFKEDCPEKAG